MPRDQVILIFLLICQLVNIELILDDLESYFRRSSLKEFFLDEDEGTSCGISVSMIVVDFK